MSQKQKNPIWIVALLMTLTLFSLSRLAALSGANNLFATPNGSGTTCTQVTPCQLSVAVAQAVDGDTVYVAAGTYTGDGSTVEVVSVNSSISLLGGWNGAPSGGVVRDPALYVTIIDGENDRRGISVLKAGIIDGFTIRNGAQVNFGAGILLDTAATGTAIISNNIFSDNVAVWFGGGISIEPNATAVINNNQFYGNMSGNGSMDSYFGGGLLVRAFSTATISHNLFQGNQSSSGAAIATDRSHITVERNQFVANFSPLAVSLSASGTYNAHLSNNLFKDNTGYGLGVSGSGYSNAQILHNTFVNNGSSGVHIHALTVDGGGGAVLTNNILANHAGSSIQTSTGGTVSGSYNLFWQNGSDPYPLSNPIWGDPAFMADGYHLGPSSEAINAAMNAGIMLDIDGEPRPQNGGFDIGADESPYQTPEPAQTGPTFTVNVISDSDDGICGLTHCALREAMHAANTQAGSNDIVFTITGDILLTSQLPVIVEELTITGPGTGQLAIDGVQGNFQLLRVNSGGLTISGLTLKRGGPIPTVGGALLALAPLQVDNVHFIDNQAALGGAVAIYDTAVIHNAQFFNNQATSNDGGAVVVYGNLTVSDSLFSQNTAQDRGGAIYANIGLSVYGSSFVQNSAQGDGGALMVQQNSIIKQTRFLNNSAANGGGLALGGLANASVENSLLTNNAATGQGAALYVGTQATGTLNLVYVTIGAPARRSETSVYLSQGIAQIHNSIIANHHIGLQQAFGTATENYNLFYDNGTDRVNIAAGANSFNGNPRFVFPSTGDYRLGDGSRAVDRGNNVGVMVDFENHPRPMGSGFDIGYDEQVRRRILAPGLFDFEDTGVQMNVHQLGDLDSISVVPVEGDHPDPAGTIGLGRYWIIMGDTATGGDASGFDLDLTLPHDGATDPYICRYDGQGWDCGRDNFNGSTVTREGVTAFSDWTVVDGSPPDETTYLYLPIMLRP